MKRKKAASQKTVVDKVVFCPACMSDRLETISDRMKKCKSCGFIWNHTVSDRDNLQLIMEHQTKGGDRNS